MSIEKHSNPYKPPAKEIESMSKEEIEAQLKDEYSQEGTLVNFINVMQKITLEPNMYYLVEKEGGVSIRKRSDKSLIFFTDIPEEVEAFHENLSRVIESRLSKDSAA